MRKADQNDCVLFATDPTGLTAGFRPVLENVVRYIGVSTGRRRIRGIGALVKSKAAIKMPLVICDVSHPLNQTAEGYGCLSIDIRWSLGLAVSC